MGVIYKISNRINGKIYIGKTIQPIKNRWCNHLSEIKNHKDNCYFHNAIRKHGKENFDIEIIFETDNMALLDIMEIFKIMVNKSHRSQNGYNLTWGGDGTYGYKHTEESKMKMSEKRRGEPSHRKGKHHSEETKRKMSERVIEMGLYKGRKNPMFDVHRFGINSPHYEKTHSEETKQIIGDKNSKIYTFLSPENNVISIKNLKSFCSKNNLNYSCMNNVLSGRHKQHKGYRKL
jgi:group I intron endonuclease